MKNLKAKLKKLYPKDYEKTYQKLTKIIKDFQKNKPKKSKLQFSEKDIILICNANHVKGKNEKTLKTMKKFLDRFVKGYINRVHFLPFYKWSNDRGFAVDNYYKIKKEYGTWADIKNISKKFTLMFDLVVNHVSFKCPWFKKFLQGNKYYSRFFITYDKPVDVSRVFRPRTDSLLKKFKTKKGEKYVWCTFPLEQADINFSNPEVFLEMIRVLLFYINNGAKVIRMDAIAFIWKKLGTDCLHLPQAHLVVKLMRQILDKVAPEIWIITETNVPHKDNVSYFGNGHDEAHLVYNFTLPPLLLYTFLTENSQIFTKWAKSLKLPSNKTTFFNFTASHDGIGVTPLKGVAPNNALDLLVKQVKKQKGVVSYRDVPGQKPVPYELNITYLDAMGSTQKFIASQAVMLAMRGVPAIYWNSLIGAKNWLAGLKKYKANRIINEEKFNYNKLAIELNNKNSIKHQVYSQYTKLIKKRINEPLFSPLASGKILNWNSRLIVIHRLKNKKQLVALTNVSNKDIELSPLKLKKIFNKKEVKNIIDEKKFSLDKDIIIKPYEVLWLK